jgi:hypothetical protein
MVAGTYRTICRSGHALNLFFGMTQAPSQDILSQRLVQKSQVRSLIERGGPIRSVVLENLRVRDVRKVLSDHVDVASHLMTDTAPHYDITPFEKHSRVNHKRYEFARGEAYTNTLEGYFSLFKRGMKGVYQHCSEKHLHRYLAEFDFRYNNRARLKISDTERAEIALRGIVGKRLTYKAPPARSAA